MLVVLCMYLMIGAVIARAQMREEEDKVDEARKYYPDYMVLIAMVLAFAAVVLVWPYVVYEAFKEDN